MSPTNQKGSILIYAITAIAAMSLPVIYLSSLSIQKLKASRNIETSITAYYKAESGIEQIMYQTKEDLKSRTALATNMPAGQKYCGVDDPFILYQDCHRLDIQYTANELNLDLPQNQTIQLNLYDLNNSALSLGYLIDRIHLTWPSGNKNFEFTAVYWDKNTDPGKIIVQPPVKWKTTSVGTSLDYIFDGTRNFPAVITIGNQYLAKIRITALDAVQQLKITVLDGAVVKDIPGFITLQSVGQEGNTQQSIKVVRAYNATNYFSSASSGLWDFVLFSGSGITK